MYAIADKYDVHSIYDPIIKHVQHLLSNGITISATNEMLSVILEAHYGGSGGARIGSPLGTVITSAIVKHHNTYLGTPLFKDVLVAHPTFGADVALALVKPFKAVRQIKTYRCSDCAYSGTANLASLADRNKNAFYCENCGSSRPLYQLCDMAIS